MKSLNFKVYSRLDTNQLNIRVYLRFKPYKDGSYSKVEVSGSGIGVLNSSAISDSYSYSSVTSGGDSLSIIKNADYPSTTKIYYKDNIPWNYPDVYMTGEMKSLFMGTDPYNFFLDNYEPAYVLYSYSSGSDSNNWYYYYRYYYKISSSSYKRILVTRTKKKSDSLADATYSLTQEASLTSPSYTYKRGSSGKIILSTNPDAFRK